jgi:CRP/FNR family transcriptional regulator, cyclic AMP receptor protein
MTGPPQTSDDGVRVRAARLLDLDPDLGLLLSASAAEEARRHAVVPAVELASGLLDVRALVARGLRPFGTLVADGLLVRDVVLGQTVASELLGPGDVVALDSDDPALVPMTVRWAVAETATIALLDDRLLPALRAWPELGRALLQRSMQRAARVEAQRAISQLARVEDRLVALFGMLADRFARMTPAGLVISVSLTHAMLGRLVEARRPTVSLALKALAEDGSVVRREDGSWLLSVRALEAIASATEEAGPTRAEAALVILPAEPAEAPHGVSAAEIARLAERIAAMREAATAMKARSEMAAERARYLRSRSLAARNNRPAS